MLIAIFTIRPLFDDRFALLPWYGLYVPSRAEESIALTVGIVAFVGILTGVFLSRMRPSRLRVLNNLSPSFRSHSSWSFGRAKLVLATTLGLSIYLVLLVAFAGPGIIRQLSGGRSSDVTLAGLPEIVLIIPLAGSISAALFLLAARDRQLLLLDVLLVVGSAAASALMVSQLGTRRFIIPALLLPLIAALIRRPVRVKIMHIALGSIALLFLAIIPMVRAAGARRIGENLGTASLRYFQEEGISGVLRPVFASYDTEMFDYIAIASRGLSGDQFGLGRGTVIEFFLRPIPSFMGLEEVLGTPFSDEMLGRLFAGGCGEPFCPVASLPGVLYFDGGFALVFVGSVIAGATLRKLANCWVFNNGLSPMQMLVVVSASSFALVAARTNTIHTLWWCIYTLGIGFAILKVMGAEKRSPRVESYTQRLTQSSEGGGNS
ncbi:hypothetical protein [Arthrobacter sp. MDT1-65]